MILTSSELSREDMNRLAAQTAGKETMPRAGAAPGISVLIPLYCAGRYIREAVGSAAAQGAPVAEIIVVDDGSEDESARAAWESLRTVSDEIPVVLACLPHRGQAAARNTALSLASGEWIFYLDADDILEEGALASLAEAAARYPQADMICSKCRDFISPELSAEERARLRIAAEPYQRMLAGCLLIRWEVFGRVGQYDETLPSSETAQWMLRARDAGVKMLNIDTVTLRRRYHANNFGRRSRRTQLESYMAIIKQRRSRGEQ